MSIKKGTIGENRLCVRNEYAALPENRKDTNFIAPKNRPSVELFDAHCRMVVDDHQLNYLHIKGRALELQNKVKLCKRCDRGGGAQRSICATCDRNG